MYDSLTGELIRKSPAEAVVLVSGVGYHVELSLRGSGKLPAPGSQVTLLVHHKVQDDRFRLFGFHDEAERRLFRALIRISGVGAKMALRAPTTTCTSPRAICCQW